MKHPEATDVLEGVIQSCTVKLFENYTEYYKVVLERVIQSYTE